MKTSVCIFSDGNDAKEMVQYLRGKHLGVTLERQTAILETGEEIDFSVLAAERPEHPLILDRVAEMDSMHASLVRCHRCHSSRLSIALDSESPAAVRFLLSMLGKFGQRPRTESGLIICRDCTGTMNLANTTSSEPIHGKLFADVIAA